MAENGGDFEYDVALSFAGEDRETVERFANLLEADGFSVFYDNWSKAELWGKDLYVHLTKIYRDESKYCLMLLSERSSA